MRKSFKPFFFLSLLLILSCSNKNELKDGDLLFIAKNDSNLEKAITGVTQVQPGTLYSHIAIVQVTPDTIWVWDASPEHGTRKLELSSFIREQNADIHHYRIKKEYLKDIRNIWHLAEKMQGKPYNFSYQMNDTSYYCSDFIYRLFPNDSIFTLNPMTFKNPQTGKFDTTWVEYYHKLGIKIPESELGCNPNGFAANDKLDYLGKLYY